MATIKINLSAPIYGSDGTSIVPNKPDERVEPAGELLLAVQRAFRRQLREAGPEGDAMRASFGKRLTPLLFPSCVSSTNDHNLGTGLYEFVGEMPVGYTHVRFVRNGRNDIRIYGHPSGEYFNSAAKFVPHVVFLLTLKVDPCECELCGH